MAHNHVNEYQIRIADEDGTEKLTRWMNSEEQLAHCQTYPAELGITGQSLPDLLWRRGELFKTTHDHSAQ